MIFNKYSLVALSGLLMMLLSMNSMAISDAAAADIRKKSLRKAEQMAVEQRTAEQNKIESLSSIGIVSQSKPVVQNNSTIRPAIQRRVVIEPALDNQPCHIPSVPIKSVEDTTYQIWPGDSLQIFVWQNPELSMSVLVRPDGLISMPLVEEMDVAGKNPSVVAREIEQMLHSYIKKPLVTIIVTNFSENPHQSIRILGAAVKPTEMRYQKNMNVLDVVIYMGGLSEFAAGNRASLVRRVCNENKTYPLKLEDLVKGDVNANVDLQPGDIIVIPESFF